MAVNHIGALTTPFCSLVADAQCLDQDQLLVHSVVWSSCPLLVCTRTDIECKAHTGAGCTIGSQYEHCWLQQYDQDLLICRGKRFTCDHTAQHCKRDSVVYPDLCLLAGVHAAVETGWHTSVELDWASDVSACLLQQ